MNLQVFEKELTGNRATDRLLFSGEGILDVTSITITLEYVPDEDILVYFEFVGCIEQEYTSIKPTTTTELPTTTTEMPTTTTQMPTTTTEMPTTTTEMPPTTRTTVKTTEVTTTPMSTSEITTVRTTTMIPTATITMPTTTTMTSTVTTERPTTTTMILPTTTQTSTFTTVTTPAPTNTIVENTTSKLTTTVEPTEGPCRKSLRIDALESPLDVKRYLQNVLDSDDSSIIDSRNPWSPEVSAEDDLPEVALCLEFEIEQRNDSSEVVEFDVEIDMVKALRISVKEWSDSGLSLRLDVNVCLAEVVTTTETITTKQSTTVPPTTTHVMTTEKATTVLPTTRTTTESTTMAITTPMEVTELTELGEEGKRTTSPGEGLTSMESESPFKADSILDIWAVTTFPSPVQLSAVVFKSSDVDVFITNVEITVFRDGMSIETRNEYEVVFRNDVARVKLAGLVGPLDSVRIEVTGSSVQEESPTLQFKFLGKVEVSTESTTISTTEVTTRMSTTPVRITTVTTTKTTPYVTTEEVTTISPTTTVTTISTMTPSETITKMTTTTPTETTVVTTTETPTTTMSTTRTTSVMTTEQCESNVIRYIRQIHFI
ncbi:mucin-2-like [Anneissia japonica]|uniref:mucin-2-like n=1 Tax=Anneissia japonica TaxID=1529436 RepID=UPI0014255D54|nr:mucin-2-like [Anneissia japonica]